MDKESKKITTLREILARRGNTEANAEPCHEQVEALIGQGAKPADSTMATNGRSTLGEELEHELDQVKGPKGYARTQRARLADKLVTLAVAGNLKAIALVLAYTTGKPAMVLAHRLPEGMQVQIVPPPTNGKAPGTGVTMKVGESIVEGKELTSVRKSLATTSNETVRETLRAEIDRLSSQDAPPGTGVVTVRHANRQRGEDHCRSKLTKEQVREIRAHPELSTRELSVKYGVDGRTIGAVRSGRAWAWLN